MNAKDKKIIEAYLKLKIKAVYADLQLIQLKKTFYKACARNSVRISVDNNRIVDLRGTQFQGKLNIREAFTRRIWKYSRYIQKLESDLSQLKKDYENKHNPVTKSKRIWAVDMYNNIKAQEIFINKVIHKGKIYDKADFKRRKTEAMVGTPKS
jgi:hypothetical protein